MAFSYSKINGFADVTISMCSLKEREDQLTSLEAELSQLTEELDTIKNATGTHTSVSSAFDK